MLAFTGHSLVLGSDIPVRWQLYRFLKSSGENRREWTLRDPEPGLCQDRIDPLHEHEQLDYRIYRRQMWWNRVCEQRHDPCKDELSVRILCRRWR